MGGARWQAGLRCIERGLFAAGAALALWCAILYGQARYYQSLPIPPPTVTASYPTAGPPPSEDASSLPAPLPLERGAWVARLEAPSVHLAATVLEGSDNGTLAKAAGHIEYTALPGQPGNVGIAGHRDTTFRAVRHLHAGDPLVLTTRGQVLHYRITKTSIVSPDDVSVLDPTPRPVLTLVTCYPFEYIGHAPKRFIVRADLVEQDARR